MWTTWSECNVTCNGGMRNRTCVGNDCSVGELIEECNMDPCQDGEGSGLATWLIGLIVVIGLGAVILVVCLVVCVCIPRIRKKQVNDGKAGKPEKPEEPVYVLNVVGESNPAYGNDQQNQAIRGKRESEKYTEILDFDIGNHYVN